MRPTLIWGLSIALLLAGASPRWNARRSHLEVSDDARPVSSYSPPAASSAESILALAESGAGENAKVISERHPHHSTNAPIDTCHLHIHGGESPSDAMLRSRHAIVMLD